MKFKRGVSGGTSMSLSPEVFEKTCELAAEVWLRFSPGENWDEIEITNGFIQK